MHFEFIQALLLLVLLPPLFLIMRSGQRRTAQMAVLYRAYAPQQAFYRLRYVLAGLFFGSMSMVAARPYIESGRTADVLFLIDVSRSMHARHSCGDLTFLDRAKNIMRDVLNGVPEARFGIVAFDRFAFPITHLTRDRTYLNEVIDNGVHVGLTFEATRTEIANALSVMAMKKTRLPEIYSNVNTVIMLSDGHIDGDYTRSLRQPLQQLRDAGIRMLTVGVGNPGETPVLTIEREQCVQEFIELDGNVVKIPLRDDILKFIASESGGRYFAEGDTEGLLNELRAGLAQVDDTTASAATGRHRRDISPVFLLIGTVALFGLLLTGSGVRWRRMFAG